MRVNRKKVSIIQNIKDVTEEHCYINKSKALSFVWELTEEIYSLTGKYDVKSRLQRNAVSIIRE